MATSTANDQLFQYSMTINSLTLTSKSGNTVDLLTTPIYVEFMHLNGTAEPLATVSVPEDAYTRVTATIGTADFTCASIGGNGVIATSNFYTYPVPASDIAISVPSPIQISGAGMLLTLNLLVSQSESYTTCYTNGLAPFSTTPTFSASATAISARPTSSGNGELIGLEGIIASADSASNSIVVNSADGSNYGGVNARDSIDPANGPQWRTTFDSSTVFQGITNSSQLATGLAVDIDGSVQTDGSLLATRIAVYDTEATNTSLWIVPALFEDDALGTEMLTGEKEEVGSVLGGDDAAIDFASSQFQISRQMSNLAGLPFQPSFTAASLVAGQNIAPTFHESNYGNSILGPTPSTITLLPQTINGTVSSIGSEGGFTIYTVTLAPYDLFPALAVQPGQTTLLTDPNTVVVYADSNTRTLNTTTLAVGDVGRFYGLVFNDNGTLRMDCAQINDGVAE